MILPTTKRMMRVTVIIRLMIELKILVRRIMKTNKNLEQKNITTRKKKKKKKEKTINNEE